MILVACTSIVTVAVRDYTGVDQTAAAAGRRRRGALGARRSEDRSPESHAHGHAVEFISVEIADARSDYRSRVVIYGIFYDN